MMSRGQCLSCSVVPAAVGRSTTEQRIFLNFESVRRQTQEAEARSDDDGDTNVDDKKRILVETFAEGAKTKETVKQNRPLPQQVRP